MKKERTRKVSFPTSGSYLSDIFIRLKESEREREKSGGEIKEKKRKEYVLIKQKIHTEFAA
jgi:hypothetical protein